MDKQTIIKSFSQAGLTLRPVSLKQIQTYLQKEQDELSQDNDNQLDLIKFKLQQLIEKLKQISKESLIEENEVTQGIEMLRFEILEGTKKQQHQQQQYQQQQNKNQMEIMEESNFQQDELDLEQKVVPKIDDELQDIDSLLLEKFKQSIIVLDIFKEINVSVLKEGGKIERVKKQDLEQFQTGGLLGSDEQKNKFFWRRFSIIKKCLEQWGEYSFQEVQKNSVLEDFQKKKLISVGQLSLSKGILCLVYGNVYDSFDGEFYLQDENGKVKLDLKQNKPQIKKGYLTSDMNILVEGVFDEARNRLIVSEFIQPFYRTEKTFKRDYKPYLEKVKKIIGDLILMEVKQKKGQIKVSQQNSFVNSQFSIHRQLALQYFDLGLNAVFQNRQKYNLDFQVLSEMSVIVLSDFLISNRGCLKNFEEVLQVIQDSQMKPAVFVLMGQFFGISAVKKEEEWTTLKQQTKEFLNVLEKYPQIKNGCYFILVPHAAEIGLNFFPKKEIEESVFEDIAKNIPFLIRTTNPAKVSIFGKEFVFFRADLMKELRKHSIVENKETSFEKQMIHTIISQRHLFPLSNHFTPIAWNHDDTLSFDSKPDFLIYSDNFTQQFNQLIDNNYYVINPGSFNKFATFTVINPLQNWVSDSQLTKNKN